MVLSLAESVTCYKSAKPLWFDILYLATRLLVTSFNSKQAGNTVNNWEGVKFASGFSISEFSWICAIDLLSFWVHCVLWSKKNVWRKGNCSETVAILESRWVFYSILCTLRRHIDVKFALFFDFRCEPTEEIHSILQRLGRSKQNFNY